MDIEEQCIAKTREHELAKIVEDLKLCSKMFDKFELPFAGISLNFSELSLKQMLLLPVAFIMVVFLFLLTPIAYIDHIFSSKKQKGDSKRKIKDFQDKPLEFVSPTEKTIFALWVANSPDYKSLRRFNRLTLLYDWVDILYGEGAAAKLRLAQRGTEIARSQSKANEAYYKEEDAPYFIFKEPADILVEQLSQELPFYNWVGSLPVLKVSEGSEEPKAT